MEHASGWNMKRELKLELPYIVRMRCQVEEGNVKERERMRGESKAVEVTQTEEADTSYFPSRDTLDTVT